MYQCQFKTDDWTIYNENKCFCRFGGLTIRKQEAQVRTLPHAVRGAPKARSLLRFECHRRPRPRSSSSASSRTMSRRRPWRRSSLRSARFGTSTSWGLRGSHRYLSDSRERGIRGYTIAQILEDLFSALSKPTSVIKDQFYSSIILFLSDTQEVHIFAPLQTEALRVFAPSRKFSVINYFPDFATFREVRELFLQKIAGNLPTSVMYRRTLHTEFRGNSEKSQPR